ncbi:predicted protein [Postia placenta Mad-698-R]|uniref:Uncharacterized protein n=1 Tax=Postia placenta MAD-698-R-SB12 TaxID=670580 RepID=A0A1X6N6Y2_9APHY|nr:hypothetical protein POSPLADRAFT_1137785 [Postia placenta MAD-698-R-SB12]EED85537.1 predicted protein [Postia placenta Mad-698-R]OSX64388.1 hypothetical protein POSPLADRAFT_1137785 [Postia placenta MAD-698-R-SB12]
MADAPRLASDPGLQLCPEFADPEYGILRQGLVAAGQVASDAAATEHLIAIWSAHNAAKRALWAAQVEGNRLADTDRLLLEAEACQHADDATAEEALLTQEKRRLQLGTLHFNRDAPSFLDQRPSAYALHKLAKGEYVELWYFTVEGCATARNDRSTAEEAYGITRTDDTLALRPLAAHCASRQAVPDEKLTWDQFCAGNSELQLAVEAAGWPAAHVAMLEAFFYTLSRHPFTRRPRGKDALLLYQARLRRHWHTHLAQDEGYNLSNIKEDLLNEMLQEIASIAHKDRISRLVHAQHADVAPGAVDSDVSISGM